MSGDNSIFINVDELIDKLEAIKEDEFSTVKISLETEGYSNVLSLEVVSIDSDEPISYGSIDESTDEI